MPEFDSYMKDAFQFLNETHGEDEDLVYRFRNGGTRSIIGIVNRNPPQQLDAAGNIVTPFIVVSLMHDSTLGVLHTEVNAGDQIDLEVKPGGGQSTRLVKKVNDPDSGTITIEVA
jgi:hypothetical protein